MATSSETLEFKASIIYDKCVLGLQPITETIGGLYGLVWP